MKSELTSQRLKAQDLQRLTEGCRAVEWMAWGLAMGCSEYAGRRLSVGAQKAGENEPCIKSQDLFKKLFRSLKTRHNMCIDIFLTNARVSFPREFLSYSIVQTVDGKSKTNGGVCTIERKRILGPGIERLRWTQKMRIVELVRSGRTGIISTEGVSIASFHLPRFFYWTGFSCCQLQFAESSEVVVLQPKWLTLRRRKMWNRLCKISGCVQGEICEYMRPHFPIANEIEIGNALKCLRVCVNVGGYKGNPSTLVNALVAHVIWLDLLLWQDSIVSGV